MGNYTAEATLNGSQITFDYDGSESGFWKGAAELLLKTDIPGNIRIDSPHGSAVMDVKERGTYTENGVEKPSMFVSVTDRTYGLMPSEYPKKYLTCIHPESNNYKAYILLPNNAGGRTVDVTAQYGSIDAVAQGNYRTVKTPYEPHLFWVRYYEKLSKGYVDQSDIFFDDKPAAPKKAKRTAKGDTNPASVLLYNMLIRYAKHVVSTHLASPKKVTVKQVKEARKIWNLLGKRKTVKGFNAQLMKLMMISPRKRNPFAGDTVSQYLARSEADFPRIIQFEEGLLNAMEAVAGVASEDVAENGSSFKDFGVDVFDANDKQKQEVMDLLPADLKRRVSKIYRVKPLEQEKRFAKYCKKHKISQIKKLWHGSTNENWASIIENGLLLNPNARITGKMFGNGIYFAPSANKSFNYTSCRGTTWAHGTDSKGFMGVYATAYGSPMYVSSSGMYTKAQVEGNGHNCIHARAQDTGLRADEIIFYDEAAICLNYIVEFAA